MRENGSPSFTIPEVARGANVPEAFVHNLVRLGILPAGGTIVYSVRDVRRARLLHAWEAAGLPLAAVARMLEEGTLSLDFLDAPSLTGPEPLDRSYAELAEVSGVSLPLVKRLHAALGFAPPRSEDQAREDDAELVAVAKMFLSVGVDESSLLGLVRVYADSLRRVAKAEAELYESEIEEPLRLQGLEERQLIEFGSGFGDRLLPALERTLNAVYRRHREHVWIEHAVYHAELELQRMGLHERVQEPSAICFVDLTGYTRMTEERGDETAARVARSLSSLVYDTSRRHGGRPIRWLGDGGMFHFRRPRAAVLSGLEMADEAPSAGLPPTHIGIHTGSVIYQDGDVYGRTVNIASRIASQAGAGEVFVSEETVRGAGDDELHFTPLRSVELKGISAPIRLYRASRRGGTRADD